jgi:hypothetical protein
MRPEEIVTSACDAVAKRTTLLSCCTDALLRKDFTVSA